MQTMCRSSASSTGWRRRPGPNARKLKEERGALGFWLSGHPYELYQHEVAHYTSLALGQIQPSRDSVKLAGVVTNVRVVQGKRGRMGVVQLDDGTAVLEVVCFSEAWERLKNKFCVGRCRLHRGARSL